MSYTLVFILKLLKAMLNDETINRQFFNDKINEAIEFEEKRQTDMEVLNKKVNG